MTWYRGRRSGLALTALAVAAIGVTALAYRQAKAAAEAQPAPTGEGAPKADGAALRVKCLNNVKQLGLAELMYASDYDELYPPANRWCDATYPYIKSWELHHCPADTAAFSYAMNHKLSRVSLSKVAEPMHTICLYESSTGRKNECDQHGSPGDSVPVPPRHQGGNNFGFVDGHAKSLEPEATPLDLYHLVKEEPHGAPPGDTKWAK
jgi:prepilin-type processing-associated H-X9-DG protein